MIPRRKRDASLDDLDASRTREPALDEAEEEEEIERWEDEGGPPARRPSDAPGRRARDED